jgi:lipopolysaccharide biosynthesis regulator YciM
MSDESRHAHLLGESLLAALEPGGAPAAEALLAELVSADSGASVGYLALAALYRQRGEVGRSIHLHQNLLLRSDLEDGLRLRALMGLAEDYRAGGFLQRAMSAFEEVVAYRPREERALHALVDLCSDLREYDRALTFHRRLERVRRERDVAREADLLVLSAEQAHEAGHTEQARRAVKRALRRSPNHPAGGILLGRLEAEKGRDKAALRAWRQVLEQGAVEVVSPAEADPDRAVDLYGMVEASFAALHRARDYEGFLRDLLKIRPGDAQVVLALSRTLSARGEAAASLKELRSFVEGFPDQLMVRVRLMRALLDQGRSAEAMDEVSALVTRLGDSSALFERESVE